MEEVKSYVLRRPKKVIQAALVSIRVLVYLLSMPARDLELLRVQA